MTTRNWPRIPLLIGLCLALAFLLTPAKEAQACMSDCQICWDFGCNVCSVSTDRISCTSCGGSNEQIAAPPVLVNFVSPRHVRLTIEGYKTTNLQPTTSCVTAFSPVDGVERVNSIRNYNSDINRPFQEVAFAPAETPGREIATLAEQAGFGGTGEPWFGFSSKITGTIVNNVSNHFVVDLTLKKGVRPEDFVQALKTQGVFVTSSSTPDGVPNEGHQYYRRMSNTELLVLYPNRPEKPEKPIQ